VDLGGIRVRSRTKGAMLGIRGGGLHDALMLIKAPVGA
jgi:hypothetical protein